MEWAMAIPRGEALEWVEEDWGDLKDGTMADILEVGKAQFGSVSFTRMYFGQEFCEKALPTQKELLQALTVS